MMHAQGFVHFWFSVDDVKLVITFFFERQRTEAIHHSLVVVLIDYQ